MYSLYRYVLPLLLAAAAWGAETSGVLWQSEMESLLRAPWDKTATVVDDPAASDGKAVRIEYRDPGSSSWIFSPPKHTLQGKCFFTFYLRGENLLPISHGLAFTLVVHSKVDQNWQYRTQTVVYGINLKPTGYTAVTLPLPVGIMPDTFPYLSVLIRAPNAPEGRPMAMYLDKMETRTQVITAPVITAVKASKIRYEPKDKASVTMTVVNPTDARVAGELVGEERLNLNDRRPAFTVPVELAPGETREVTGAWQLGGTEYGREIAVDLRVNGKTVDAASALFSISSTPRWLSVSNGADERREYWDWAPGDLADLAPKESIFCSGQGVMFYRSRAQVQRDNVAMVAAGYWPESYVNGTAWGEAGYQLFARHPDWFLFDSKGEVAVYDMKARENFRDRHDAEFDRENANACYMFQGTLNHALPAVQDFIAGQLIRSATEMGFKGARFDVRYLQVEPGEYDFLGKEVAPTRAEADRISAAAVKRVKGLVHAKVPDFTFGYNYGAPEEMLDMPLTTQERCRDSGWILDETSCTYQEKHSPYHVWSAYAKRMVSWGDQINRWGGIYNPFIFRRGGAKYPVDCVYTTIFLLIAGGRSPFCPPFYDARLPFGNAGQLATRFSECFYGRQRRLIPEVKGEVEVKSAAPLWWKDFVFRNTDTAGMHQLIVNLVNPPLAADVEDDPLSRVPVPVRDIKVLCAPEDDKRPTAAYLLTAEAMEPDGTPTVQAIPLTMTPVGGGKVSVTVPSVLFWKIVVFQY